MAELLQFPAQSAFDFFTPEIPSVAEDTLTFSDAEARAAALDIRRSWIVEAPAGSGKTGLLIQRFLKLLAQGEVRRPGEVLAITFTRKAAAELRSRVLEQLSEAASDHPLPPGAGAYAHAARHLAREVLARDRHLGWRLLDTPHGLNISTIDAFCAQLAGSRPLLSAGAGRYQPVDDALPLYEGAAERTVRELGSNDQALDQALRTVLLHRDGLLGDVIQLIAGMLANREQWGELVPLGAEHLTDAVLDHQVRPKLEATLERAICSGLSEAAAALGPQLLGELSRFAHRHSSDPGYKGAPSPLALCSSLPHPPAIEGAALDQWLALVHLLLTSGGDWRAGLSSFNLGFDISKSGAEPLRDLISQATAEDQRRPGLKQALCAVRLLPPARYPEDQWRMVKALFRVLRRALAELTVLFAERGQCDFTEIALSARALLGTGTDLHNTPGAQLTHLLVDEMQDTSAGQYELLESLTRSWDGASQTVFLVGDPKQSIYLFRQARVARFLRMQATGLLGDLRLGALRLTANFRSQATLVDEFNGLFSQILPPPGQLTSGSAHQVDVPFVAAEPTRPAREGPALIWHTRLVPPEDRTEDEDGIRPQAPDPGAHDDARAIRERIAEFTRGWNRRKALSDSPQPRVAVLARSRAHLAPVIAEFQRDRGSGKLPFRAVQIELLNERPEVLDLLAITRALLHPGDRVAWLAILRSPVCGLELSDLLALCGEGSEADPSATLPHLVQTRRHQLSQDGQRQLERVWPSLATALADHRRTALSTEVERTWRSLGADALLNPDQLANARRFLSLLRKLEAGQEPVTVALLDRALKKLYAESLAAPEAVDLMTIHKAKGLEWDLVLVPALHRDTGNNRHELLRWLELDGDHGAEANAMLAPIHGKGEDSSRLSKWLGNLQSAREAAETKRLLYVACTRAREELHLFTAVATKRDGSLTTPRANTLLRAAWPAALPVLSRLLTFPPESQAVPEAGSEQRPASDYGGVVLSLAAAGGEVRPPAPAAGPTVYRVPETFHPLDRFKADRHAPIRYTPASQLRHTANFDRPEGSFAARAFGNVVHRFLDLVAETLASGERPSSILASLPRWATRLQVVFRGEGLPPALCARETERALEALKRALADPLGCWILSGHAGALNEHSLQIEADESTDSPGRLLRADRTFLAGAEPLSLGAATHRWIVDFKTAEPGGRTPASFFAAERQKYEAQLNAYAQAMLAQNPQQRIVLALYYPLLPHLLYWPYVPNVHPKE